MNHEKAVYFPSIERFITE